MSVLKGKNRWLWIGGIAITILIVAAIVKQKTSPKGQEVSVHTVSRQTIRERVQASGKIFPVKEVKISPEISGEIVEMTVKVGDSVRAGQLLARINPDIYESATARSSAGVGAAKAQLGQAKAGIEASRNQLNQLRYQREQAEANAENARLNFKRNAQLHKDGVISNAELESAQQALLAQEAMLKAAGAAESAAQSAITQAQSTSDAAQYNIKSSEAVLSEAAANMKRTTIYAPMNGIVSRLNVQKGERVVGSIQMSGTEIMRIANLDQMEVQVDVNENEIMRIRMGDSTDVELDAYPRRKFKGRVTEIARTASNALSATGQALINTDQVTNFTVKILLDPVSYADLTDGGRRNPFLPGMSATADIYTRTVSDVLAVPISAVAQRDKESFAAKLKSAERDDDETTQVERTINDIRIVAFVMQGDTVHMADVVTGAQDEDYIEIVSGLQPNDQVVFEPYDLVARKLKPGDRVRLKKEKVVKKAS
jgi:HlyD family secretion protein